MTITSYAQNFEDIMLWRALKGIEHGVYIDVGAWSPDIDSVTRLFYEAGWSGLNIEPNQVLFDQLVQRRPHDKNFKLALSDRAGTIDLHVVGDTGLSSVNVDIARRGAEAIQEHDVVVTVPVMTLAELWDRHVPEGQPVHFLKIDVEGSEEAVLRGGDWRRHRPWIVVVEAIEPLTQTQNHHSWDPFLREQDYDFVWFDAINRFYIAREHSELAAALQLPPNYFDGFLRAGHEEAAIRAATAEARLAELQKIASKQASHEAVADLSCRLDDLSVAIARLSERMTDEALRSQTALTRREQATDHMGRLATSAWVRPLFHPTGRPRKPLRLVLFNSDGQPRALFRRWIRNI